MKPVESIIMLPSQVRFVNPALAFIRATAASCGFSESALNDIEVAAEEALTNVIKHAFEGHPDETFKLSVRFTETDFMITIHEKGMPFSPDKVPDYDPGKLEKTQVADGLGVYLMKSMMDDVIFENLGRDGKSLTLLKRIDTGQTKPTLEDGGNEVLVKDKPAAAMGDISYEMRPFRPEDALEVSRCAYQAYGYTYDSYIYYPEEITEKNESGELRSFIAAGKNSGEIMGHIALKYKNPDDRIAEIGVAFVKPEYRKSGILRAMNDFCYEQAVESKLFGLFGRAVTSHITSQKAADAMDFVACGVSLGLLPVDLDFKALTGKARQKESALLLYHRIFEEEERKIYPPLKHRNKISDLFKSLDIPVEFAESGEDPTAERSRINVNIINVLNIADIEVTAIGIDIKRELKSIHHDLCMKRLDAIFVQIDMEDRNSSLAAEQSEELGYCFSGVLPFGMKNRHELILQYMNNLGIDYDMIKLYSSSAVDLLNYIREDLK